MKKALIILGIALFLQLLTNWFIKIEVLIYDPLIKTNKIFGAKVINDLKLFFKQTEIIMQIER